MARVTGKGEKTRKSEVRRRGKASSCQGPVSSTRATREAWEFRHRFQENWFDTAKEIEEVEAVFRAPRLATPDAQILEEVQDWVTYPVNSETHDTKYFKIAETYWIVKALVAQALEKNKEEHQDILHNIRIFKGKFEVMCQTVQEEGSSSSAGTRANPIVVDTDSQSPKAAQDNDKEMDVILEVVAKEKPQSPTV